MLAALASAALIAAGSLLVGQAAMTLCGRREWTWLSGPVGLALLLAVAAIAASRDARGNAIAICIGALLALSAAAIAWRGRGGGGPMETAQHGREHGASMDCEASPSGLFHPGPALGAALLAALLAASPFIAAGSVGILGVGLVNDDMASHLLIADWIDERFRPEPVFIDQGYPLGPHALVAGLSTVLHASSIDVFAGLVIAIPMLTALVAFEALSGLRALPRVLCAAVVSLPYMVAAYLAQEAFKEPLLALFLLTFALLLPRTKTAREAIPLGVLAAGAIYVYSFPGLAWLAGTAIVWGAIELARGKRIDRVPLVAAGVGAVSLLILIAPELPRLIDFKDFRALDPERANEGGLGNLRRQISPLTALGIWPTSEFRLPAGAGSLPAVAFYAGALGAALAFVLALPRWIRRHGAAIPAALLTAAGLYVFARAWGTVYTSGKAIAIAAPLITLVIVGGLLGNGPLLRRRWLAPALATLVAAASAFSSFLILRQAPVGPEDHMNELAAIRPLVEGEKLLFLGRDNFVLYELRGSKPFTHVRNFYDPYFVEPNFELEDVGSKFDFDSVTARTLGRFRHVLTTRAAYASGSPPGYEVVEQTPTYVLWEKSGGPLERAPAEADARPGLALGCPRTSGRGTAAAFLAEPIVIPASAWSSTTVKDGSSVTTEVEIPDGAWEVSLQYDATRPLTLDADLGRSGSTLGYASTLPANLDYRGPAPFYAAGSIAGGSSAEITATVESPPFLGRLLGADSVAHLGALALTPSGAGYVAGAQPPHPGSSAELIRADRACGRYADWFARRPR